MNQMRRRRALIFSRDVISNAALTGASGTPDDVTAEGEGGKPSDLG